MNKRIIAILTTAMLAANVTCLNAEAARLIRASTSDPANIEVIDGEKVLSRIVEIYEGERIGIVVDNLSDVKYISYSSKNNRAAVSADLIMIGYRAGEDVISLYVEYKNGDWDSLTINVKVIPTKHISDEERQEIEKLEQKRQYSYLRRQIELAGGLSIDNQRLTLEKVREIIDSSEDPRDIYVKMCKYHGFPDAECRYSNSDDYIFWLDDKGSEYVEFASDCVIYGKVAENGNDIAFQTLYPEKYATELITPESNSNSINYWYIEYHELDKIGNGTVNLNFIDEETGEAFTDTSGTFQIVSDFGTLEEKVVKSWNVSEGSSITVTDLPKDKSYELRYFGDIHGEFPEESRYIIDYSKSMGGRIVFGLKDKQNITVYMDKLYSSNPYLLGDVNGDKNLNIADLVTFRNWLMNKKDTYLINWRAADICKDDLLDVFDYCQMKKIIINK